MLYFFLGLLVLLAFSFPFFARKLAEKSGWKELAKPFTSDAARRTVKGIRIPVRSLVLGGFAYQYSVWMIVTKKGLLLGMVWPFRYSHPNILIPWKAFRDGRVGKSILGETKQFSIGRPTITVFEVRKKDWEKLKPELRGKGVY